MREGDGLSRLPGLRLHFCGILPSYWDILVQHFLPMDFWQVLHCSGPVPGSAVAELAYV